MILVAKPSQGLSVTMSMTSSWGNGCMMSSCDKRVAVSTSNSNTCPKNQRRGNRSYAFRIPAPQNYSKAMLVVAIRIMC